ncbi:MAG TPA: TolC family protein [Opitutaceae bacterium]|nr:TolC family protein [Opitutaceae bacterium]
MRQAQFIALAAAMTVLAAGAPAQEAGPVMRLESGPALTLDDAIRLALQRNRNLKVASYEPGISRAFLLEARGRFDPALAFSRTFSETQFSSSLGPVPVVDNTKADYYSAGIQGLLPVGTQYSVYGSAQEVRSLYNGFSKSFQTFAGFQVTQPLLKGFGLDSNLLQVRLAKADRTISDLTYRQSAIDTVTNVIVAYSNLQLAHDQLDSAVRASALAASLLAENEKEYKIGSISQSDVIQARANRAQYEESILIADRSVRDAQNQLRELIGESTFFEDEPLFTLVPAPVPEVAVDRKADLERAFRMRPDYQVKRLGIVQKRATESAAVNSLLPQVDFVGGYGYNGLADNFRASRQMVQDHLNPSVSAGLTVTIPLTFSVGRGSLRAARLQRIQAEEDLRRLEADIAVAVAAAEGQIETARKRVAADRAAYDLAKQALEAEEKKKKAGTSSTLYVVQEQNFVASIENSLSFALAAQRQAVAVFDQALGATLERHNIKFAED